MTEKLYLITEAQRQQTLTAAKEVDAILSNLNQPRHRGIEAAITILQSLPMVKMPLKNYDVDHANYYYHIRIAELEEQLADAKKGSEPAAMVVGKDAQKSYAISTGLTVGTVLFTSPQALTPITDDDVTDEMVSAIENAMLAIPDVDNLDDDEFNRQGAVAIFNAVIKHRSEA